MNENEISHAIIESAIEAHKTLGGPGLLESVYEEALVWELEHRGFKLERQLTVPISYKGNKLSSILRLDLLVNDAVIVEIKSVAAFNPIFEAQLLTYLRLLNKRLGLVLNFGCHTLKEGIYRVVNRL
ncbi:MAG: GxxExxY protein [Geobacter sp.]|jgi:GxxExxY protein|uniref:GxxExxY protein n=1 Tax=Trichlorobacter sp. TaxID=2911007 RepID=UPI002A36B56F|nr:GxxExxY protein [Trichlorobacter sp.]MDY0385300.1 GxxExxY protein [Trichlorobacter sp.]